MPDERARPTRDERDDLIQRQQEDIARLRDELARTGRERDQLKRQNEHLKQQLERAQRAGFRQAAPFAKDRPEGRGGRPGRRAGVRYGRRARRPIPAQVDEAYAAPFPAACPGCGGAIQCMRVTAQYQEDLVDPTHVQSLLASCDGRTTAGRRDFAILTTLARLGLRAAELAALRLDDIDWQVGEMTVHGKGIPRGALAGPR